MEPDVVAEVGAGGGVGGVVIAGVAVEGLLRPKRLYEQRKCLGWSIQGQTPQNQQGFHPNTNNTRIIGYYGQKYRGCPLYLPSLANAEVLETAARIIPTHTTVMLYLGSTFHVW